MKQPLKDNDPQSLPLIHSHDEADQLIPNQIIESAAKAPNPFANLIVFSPDTDVLTMLMNVVASGRLNATNSLKLITDKPKSKQKETIDIVERVCTIGPKKSMGLIGFHNFCGGGDWGGKSVGITKKHGVMHVWH